VVFAQRLDDDLVLGLLEERHAGLVYDVIEADREDLRTWLPWVDATRSSEDVAAFIRAALAEFAAGRGLTCGIWYRGVLAGVASLQFVPEHQAAEIGYWLARPARGAGIATRSTHALIEHGFGDRRLHRIELQAATDNRKSRAVAERLGFTLEGTRRDAEWINNHFHDLALYGILSHEWADAHRGGSRPPDQG